MRGTTPSLDGGGDEVSLDGWPGRIVFGLLCLAVVVGIVLGNWMGKYPPDGLSEGRRWLLAAAGAITILGGVGLLIVLFPVR